MQSIIKHEFSEHLKVSKKTMESICKPIEIAAKLCIDSLKNGNKNLNIWQWWKCSRCSTYCSRTGWQI